MSGLEAGDTCTNSNSADAMMPMDNEQRELGISRSLPPTLVEVEEVVDELHALGEHPRGVLYINDLVPERLRERIRKLLSEEGLEELPSGKRPGARLRILEALGLCLQNARRVTFIDTWLVGETHLSSSEVEALYGKLTAASTALEILTIRITGNASENWEPKSWGLLADVLLRAEWLDIDMDATPLSGLSQLAKAVAASGRAPLPVRPVDLTYGLRVHQGSGEATESFVGKWAGSAANLNVAAPNVKELFVTVGPFADGDVAELIGEAVASLQSLEVLSINLPQLEKRLLQEEELSDDEESGACKSRRGANDGTVSTGKKKKSPGAAGRLLSEAFLRHPSNSSIHTLSVSVNYLVDPLTAEDLQVLSQVLQKGIHITNFRFEGLQSVRSSDLRDFFAELQVNGPLQLQSLSLYDAGTGLSGCGFDPDSFAMLAELLNSDSLRALKCLDFSFDSQVYGYSNAFDWPRFYASLSQMESVTLMYDGGYQQAEREVLDWITGSKDLRELKVSQLRSLNWRSLFKSLRENTALRSLSVSEEALKDDASYRELMDLLQVNSTLQEVEVDLGWGRSREAAVQEALRGKARQEGYLAEMRRGLGQGRAEWKSPKCGRIFLCGSPEAGKTRLTLTMLKVAEETSLRKKLKRLKEKVLRRTKGVEIHTLKNDDMQILVWDLAGQEIFRALQQFLFPRLSRASVFIFVFSPFQSSGVQKPQLQQAFEREFLYWLRFIASNSAITGVSLPQVMVVISHQDMYELPDWRWCDNVLGELIPQFQDIIFIHDKPHFIDGHEPQYVEPILEEVYSIFQDLFERKLFMVLVACSQLSQQLVGWSLKYPKEPVIDDQRFFSICGKIFDLQTFSANCSEVGNRRLLKTVGSYLHDVGTAIDMTLEKETRENPGKPKSNLMVVNPNWLTHEFLGHFISLNHRFELPAGKLAKEASVDGFLCKTDFQLLMQERFLAPMKKRFPKLTLEILQDLMENLDLLYVTGRRKVNQKGLDDSLVNQKGLDDSLFFIPMLFKTNSEQNLHWAMDERTSRSPKICFFGVRLCCKDPNRTSLSSAFFSRFQVMIWRKFNLTEALKKKGPLIECKFNLTSIFLDGLHIFVENDGDGDFIDVLISSTKTKRKAWKFVEQYIVQAIREMCASSKGCPGVELIMQIVRTECVKHPSSCKYRKNQSVSREDLKNRLMESIEDLGPGSEEEDLYCHTWESVPESIPTLEKGWESAIELLLPEDVDEAFGYAKQKTESLQEKAIRLRDAIKGVDNDSQNLKGSDVQTNNLLQQVRKERNRCPNPSLKNLIQSNHQQLMGEVRGVGERVEVVLAEVQDLKNQIKKMIHLQNTGVENLKLMYKKLDKLMGQSVSAREWPRRPYFTCDASLSHRITAMVEIGKPLMLHFECEERDEHHVVPDQPGYKIIVGKENCEALRKISKTSVQVIWHLLKAGLHISTGMGDLVPELQASDGSATLLTSLSMTELLHKVQLQDGSTSKQAATPCSPEDAWRFLQGFLQDKLKDRITEFFLLHQAEYVEGEPTHAWLVKNV